ncbi:hypothetical protein LY78DRAFT_657856 [Colletotrichum sublineola]|nr:hypothetical protein LY78DRAFT_657856 [Colletotrichum sublineola]
MTLAWQLWEGVAPPAPVSPRWSQPRPKTLFRPSPALISGSSRWTFPAAGRLFPVRIGIGR